MPENLLVTETALLRSLPCPMRSPASDSLEDSGVLTCAEAPAEWLIRESFEGRGTTFAQLLERLEAEWKQTPFYKAKATVAPELYHRRCLALGRACGRLRDLVAQFEIIQPVESYELVVGGLTLSGKYAVVRSDRRKRHAWIVYLRDEGRSARPLAPDVISFARALDLHRRDAGYDSIGTLHWSISTYISNTHEPEPAFAESVMRGVVGVLTGPGFPVPGDHCRSCSTLACRPDIAKGSLDTPLSIPVVPDGYPSHA